MQLIESQIYKNNANSKWRIKFVFLFLFLLPILFSSSCAKEAATETKEATTETKEDAFKVLGREQSLAEGYAFILKESGKEDFSKYAEGIKLYADAKAEFNGLIELMKKKLNKGEPFDESPEFDNTLKTAVDNRVSFTNYISEEIIGDDKGTKGFPVAIIGSASELFKVIMDAGISIWKEYRSANETRRRELLDQIEGLKWKAFHEIGGGE